MVRAGFGSAVFFGCVTIAFSSTAVSFWERVAVFALLGFLVGVVCFIYGESLAKSR